MRTRPQSQQNSPRIVLVRMSPSSLQLAQFLKQTEVNLVKDSCYYLDPLDENRVIKDRRRPLPGGCAAAPLATGCRRAAAVTDCTRRLDVGAASAVGVRVLDDDDRGANEDALPPLDV